MDGQRTIEAVLYERPREGLEDHSGVKREVVIPPELVHLLPGRLPQLLCPRHIQRRTGVDGQCLLPMENVRPRGARVVFKRLLITFGRRFGLLGIDGDGDGRPEA